MGVINASRRRTQTWEGLNSNLLRAGGSLKGYYGLSSASRWSLGTWVESIAEGGDKRVGLHFCPFLRALGQTITMLDHYVNYPEKTKIVTEAALSTQ